MGARSGRNGHGSGDGWLAPAAGRRRTGEHRVQGPVVRGGSPPGIRTVRGGDGPLRHVPDGDRRHALRAGRSLFGVHQCEGHRRSRAVDRGRVRRPRNPDPEGRRVDHGDGHHCEHSRRAAGTDDRGSHRRCRGRIGPRLGRRGSGRAAQRTQGHAGIDHDRTGGGGPAAGVHDRSRRDPRSDGQELHGERPDRLRAPRRVQPGRA